MGALSVQVWPARRSARFRMKLKLRFLVRTLLSLTFLITFLERFGRRQYIYDWTRFRPHYPLPEEERRGLPTGRPKKLPLIQFNFTRQPSRFDDEHWEIQEMRREEVVKSFMHAWEGYRAYAWGHDELLPLSGLPRTTFNGWGATLVDSLDTLWIMGLKKEFNEAVMVVKNLDWSNSTLPHANVFETTIRYLGGLLSAYDLSGEPVLLQKANELGHMLLASFDTPTHIPSLPYMNFDMAVQGTQTAPQFVASAGLGTLSMEFTRLSQLTGDPKFFDAIDFIKRFLLRSQETSNVPGMWPTFLDMTRDLQNAGTSFTIGAEADSLYEYLPKMYLLLGGLDASYETMWMRAASAIDKALIFKPMTPTNEDILFTGSARADGVGPIQLNPEATHLGCFGGGMYGLAGQLFGVPEQVEVGVRLSLGCAWGYSTFPTGVMPESMVLVPCDSRDSCRFEEEKFAKPAADRSLPKGIFRSGDKRYLLRPEAIESVFISYRITGEVIWQEIAWQMFTAIRKHTETDYGNAQVVDVMFGGVEDTMESFWLSETLKYFYLIFSPPDTISLDEYVFNTEAHPFKRPI